MADAVTRRYGLYRAVCVDTADPQKRQRIRVSCPTLFGSDTTDWLPGCFHPDVDSPNTVPTLPSFGQGVWISFEAGDPDHPVWMGIYL